MHDALRTEAARRALAERDIAAVYRLLNEAGVQQRHIAELTGQKQSEVSDIILGSRRVVGYDVFEKIADGLDIPRGWMGLAYDEDVEVKPEPAEEDEETKRRALLAVGGVALLGSPVLGEVLHIPVRPVTPTPLPARLGASDIEAIKALTSELRGVARTYGGCAETVTAVAARSLPLIVKGQFDFPLGGQLISLLADSLCPCPRSADFLLV